MQTWVLVRVLGGRTTIQVCALGFDASSGVDYAEVSVHPTGSASGCTFAPTFSPSQGTSPTSELPTASPMATSAAPVTERPATEVVSVSPTTSGASSSILDQCEVGGQYYGVAAPTYRLNSTVPKGSWDVYVSMHNPSSLIYTDDVSIPCGVWFGPWFLRPARHHIQVDGTSSDKQLEDRSPVVWWM